MSFTTLAKIKAADPCDRGWAAITAYVGKDYPDDKPIAVATLVDAVGILGAIWCLRTLETFETEKAEFERFLAEQHSQEDVIIKFLELFAVKNG